MGYGHLRAAYPLADALGTHVMAVDEPPLADASEIRLWGAVRRAHELLSKPPQLLGGLQQPARALMNMATMIPSLHEPRDHRAATWAVSLSEQLISRGLGRGMLAHLRKTGAPLLTTFYALALVVDRAGVERIYCVVTDADCNRVWAPADATRTRIHYFAPSPRVVRRLLSFGVPEKNVTLTGFPLPTWLTDSQLDDDVSLRSRVARRITRLDPSGSFRRLCAQEPPFSFPSSAEPVAAGSVTLTFAVGGAGAQVELAEGFLPSLRPMVVSGRLRVNLVAGTRVEVRDKFMRIVRTAGLEAFVGDAIQIVYAPLFRDYYDAFNRVVRDTDILWTKPSELAFYSALGLPCIVAPAVGSHERYNQRWLTENGAGLEQDRAEWARGWLEEWLEDGTLAAAAWSGFVRLPRRGTELIVGTVA